ncbi:MAG: D-glycero-beta-D-manno-heptose 1,7-bisphosphate 7-phosphatase [Magnetococcus sp. DMHC-8]
MIKQAVILAGGQGTRLGALTGHVSNPLLPLHGPPFLDHLLWNLARHGIRDIILSGGHPGEQLADYGRRRAGGSVGLRVFVEPSPLGTGGALRFLLPHLQDRFLLLNGDSLFDINYLDLPLAVDVPSRAPATIALRQVADAARHGRVELSGARVRRFLEQVPDPQPGLIYGGIAWLDRRLVEGFPAGFVSLEQEVFPHLAAEGGLLGKPYAGCFIDIGILDDCHRAGQELADWQRRPAVFLDRDGVINQDHDYVCTPDQFEWVEGAPQAIRWCNERGHLVIVVTNQSGIARGYYDEAQFQALTAWMQAELADLGAHVDAVYHCPHHPTEGVAPWRQVCHCRKPSPGLLEQAMSEWEIDRAGSLLIGDKARDVEAAQRAGVAGCLFPGGRLDLFVQQMLAGKTFSRNL